MNNPITTLSRAELNGLAAGLYKPADPTIKMAEMARALLAAMDAQATMRVNLPEISDDDLSKLIEGEWDRAEIRPEPSAPDGWVLVPIEPTEHMVIEGFESEPDETFSEPGEWEKYSKMSGCQQAAYKARLCWDAMLAASPAPGDS